MPVDDRPKSGFSNRQAGDEVLDSLGLTFVHRQPRRQSQFRQFPLVDGNERSFRYRDPPTLARMLAAEAQKTPTSSFTHIVLSCFGR